MTSKPLLLCLLFFLLWCQLVFPSFPKSKKPLCSRHQALALLQFKQLFSVDSFSSWDCDINSYPKTDSWKEESNCCSWDGVRCDRVSGHVIGLDLSCSWLYGIIPSNSSLFLFSHLQSLNLAFNDFTGSSISAGFGHFSSLMHLNLSGSGFSGKIAPEIFQLSNLVSLDLSVSWDDDEVEIASHGDLNSLLQNLTKLQKLHLGGTSISSVFPTSLLRRSSLISLDLSDCGLHGRFPDDDIHLPKLEELNLGGNYNLSGNFPRFNENNSLLELVLSYTNFSGHLPTSIGNLKSLKTLSLYKCEFTGSIPTSLENLTEITDLDIGGNHFSGQIPNVFSNLGSLTSLTLFSNNFIGHLPQSIWNLTNLQRLDCSHNQLEGIIPTHVNEFSSLSDVNLGYNLFNGTIPSWMYALPSLITLHLDRNKLTGQIGDFQYDSLEALHLSMNELHGPIPSSILKLVHLREIQLSNNKLHGSLPTLPNSVHFLSVSNNKLSGEVSHWICKVSSIAVLDLTNNNLSGQLPQCLGNFSKSLSVLNLGKNQFCGTIPQTFLKGNYIRNLDLNGNQLEGPLPRSLIICRQLEVLNLGNNKINDTFPHWLGALPKLQVLILRFNSFHGHIGPSKIKSPFMSLRIIDLALNLFEGDLPEMYLRSLKAIENIDEDNMGYRYLEHKGSYYYEDSVEVTTKGLEVEFKNILKTFTTIDLSSNKFQGEIPTCIGNLNSLRGLNLSHNNLTGNIPSSLGNLKLLESLDLSSNKLKGRIPQELASLTFLEVLNLSQNQLTGLIPRSHQLDTFGNDSYSGNLALCGIPLSKKCTDDGAPNPPYKTNVKLGNGFDWRIVLMGYGCGLLVGLSLGCIMFLTRKPGWLVYIIEDMINKRIIRFEKSRRRRGARKI